MNLVNPSELGTKLVILIPIIFFLLCILAIHKTNGNVISGFNMLSEYKKEELRKLGYVKNTQTMICKMIVPLLICFISSFFIKNERIFTNILELTWFIFALIAIFGVLSSRNG